MIFLKDNPITIGFDGARFKFNGKQETTPLIGVVCQGTRLVKVVQKNIKIDGDDSTEAIIELADKCENDVQFILMHTITFAGFNVADIKEIFIKIKIPVIAFTERMINLNGVKEALLKTFPSTYRKKIKKIINAGELFETEVKTHGGNSKVYFHTLGYPPEEVKILMEKVSIDSKLPEAVRLAHLIGASFEI